MSKLYYAYSRMVIWLRDFGHEYQPLFVDDLKTVLEAVKYAAIADGNVTFSGDSATVRASTVDKVSQSLAPGQLDGE